MKLISHRRNTLAQLRETPTHLGVEVDIRSAGDRLVIHHDPYVEGLDFEAWIAEYRHGTLILNTKEEGLEARLVESMRRRGIEDFFFLDQSFPFLVKWARQGERRCAVRVSEFESIETALTLRGMVDWVWIDCFTRFPLDTAGARRLTDAGLRLCLGSPELHGHDPDVEIPRVAALARSLEITFDAVCTKRPELWQAD